MKLRTVSALGAAVAVCAAMFSGGLAQATPACTITISESNVTRDGTAGDDVICITGNNNTINALAGNDTVIDDGDNNTINLGDGNDTFDGSNSHRSTVDGGSGNDSIRGGDGADAFNGGEGNDTLVGGYGDDSLDGGAGADNLEGDAGSDDINGEAGNDTIVGGDGNDALIGGDDLDSLDGGPGLNSCDYTPGEPHTTSCQYDDAVPQLQSYSWSGQALDVTSSAATTSVTVHVTDQTGVRSLSVECYSGSRLGPTRIISIWGNPASARDGQSGEILATNVKQRDITLTIPLTFRKGLQPGTWSCFVFSLADILGHMDTPRPLGSVVVSRGGSGWDSTAPTLSGMTLSSGTVDSAPGDVPVHVRFTLSDPSGVSSFSVGLYSSVPWRGANSSSASFAVDAAGRLTPVSYLLYSSVRATATGTANALAIDAVVTVPQGQRPVSFGVSVSASDTLGNGNGSVFYGSNLLTVTRSGTGWDDSPPELVSIHLDKQTLDSGSSEDSTLVTMHVTDATAIQNANLSCTMPNGAFSAVIQTGAYYYSGRWTGSYPSSVSVTGTQTDATITTSIRVPFGQAPGIYSCSFYATDGLNQQYSPTRLSLTIRVNRTPPGLPGAPRDASYTPGGDRDGTLSWSAPSSVGSPALYAYTTQVSTDGSTWTDLKNGATAATSLSVAHLRANTDYWIRVRGENGGTAGQDLNFMTLNWSNPVHFRTGQPALPDAPASLHVDALSGRSTSLSWSYPGYDGGADISTFNVETSRDGVTWTPVTHPNSTSGKFTLTGLTPKSTYQVRVSAVTAAGHSDYVSTQITTPVTTPTAPTKLAISTRAGTSGVLSWSLPSSNGGLGIKDYKVEFVRVGKSKWSTITHKASNSNGFVLTGLTRGVYYKLRVSAINAKGAGIPSNVLTVRIR
jgi:hypothetical protein